MSLISDPANFINDRGLSYGHGVFETLLLSDSKLPLQHFHIKRLIAGALAIGIPVDEAQLNHFLETILEEAFENKVFSGVVKILITAGESDCGYRTPLAISPKFFYKVTSVTNLKRSTKKAGVNLTICNHRLSKNRKLAGIKHLNRLDQVIGSNELNGTDFYDGIMLDEDGHIIETTCANIFIKSKTIGWITPELSSSGVAGVLREILIEDIFNRIKTNVSVRAIKLESLTKSDEIFICNSIRGIIPIVEIENLGKTIFRSSSIGINTQDIEKNLGETYPCFLK